MTAMRTELAGPHAIVTRGLKKAYGRKTALDGLDLTVPRGSVYVLVGPNGVGKTTTFHVLLDLVLPDSGSAEICGADTHAEAAMARAHVGWVPETAEPAYGWMRIGHLVRYHAAFHPTWDETYAAELVKLFEIDTEARLDRTSKGMQRRVQLLVAMAHVPPVLLLDEPTDGLDPVMRDRTASALASHLDRNPTTILLSTHRVGEVERLADHLGVVRGGRIEAQLEREALRRNLRAYHLQVPDGWTGAPALEVVSRRGSPREVAWTIWGDETEVAERLRASGATIRQVDPLSLEDAALALLSREVSR